MFELEQVKALAAIMMANEILTLEVEGNDYALRLVRAPDAMPRVSNATGSKHGTVQALSPAAGTYWSLGDDDGLTTVDRGSRVSVGDPLGYVGIGPARLLCTAPATGRLVGRLPSQGETVLGGDTLFTVETSA